MKVETVKYGEVNIRWQYDKKDNPIVTKAFLEQSTGTEKTVLKEIAVKRRYSDIHNKDLARKFSLEKLIKESFSRNDDFGDRKEIWEAYKNRKK